MLQAELRAFFAWCEATLKGFEVVDVDESTHYYLGDVLLGGFAGDCDMYFFEHSDKLAAALRMMDAEKEGK